MSNLSIELTDHFKASSEHFVLYRVKSNGNLEIGRILHDNLDLRQHLPDDYDV